MRRIGKEIIDSLTDQFRTVVPNTDELPVVTKPSPHGTPQLTKGH
jgi:hypothetical protein